MPDLDIGRDPNREGLASGPGERFALVDERVERRKEVRQPCGFLIERIER